MAGRSLGAHRRTELGSHDHQCETEHGDSSRNCEHPPQPTRAAAEGEPGDVARRDEPSGGGRNLGVTAFDDLRIVDTSHVGVGVEHPYPGNPVGRQVVAPDGFSGFLLGRALQTQNVRLLLSLT